MDTIQIPCPECGRELKLRDRSLLGRKGKCPKCGHSFVLSEPEEVQLELAEPEPQPVGAGRWVPDGGVKAVPTPRATPSRTQPAAATEFPSLVPDIPKMETDEGPSARLMAMRKNDAKRRQMGMIVGAVILVAVGGVAIYAMSLAPKKPTLVEKAAPDGAPGEQVADGDAGEDAMPAALTPTASPTKGKRIDLQFIPFGTQVVINIRPAELWKKDSAGEEVRFCLTPLAKLLEMKFEELFKRKPEQIEEAQICLIPGAQGTLPDVAAVVHLVEEAKKSQLLEDFGGQRVDDYNHPIYLSGERAYLISDQKTIAVGPKSQASEMVAAIAGRNPASDGIDELLPMTDRDRHLTVIFVPRTIRLHAPWWFPETFKPFVLQTCDWFGDEVEAASWSFHLGEKTFYSDLVLRPVSGATSPTLEREVRTKLNQLPKGLLRTIQMMDPREAGKRMVIGRVPKMSQVFVKASVLNRGPRHVQVITPLPERAAPNLALGTLLAWDESTRTDFTKERAGKPSADEGKVPDKIADRLKMKIDVDFRRTPLQDAFAYIAGEIKTTIDIEGDALKAGGFTKNMPQTFQGDKLTALDAIGKILERYQDPQKPAQTMVIVVNEEKKTILVATQAYCDQHKLTVYPVLKK